MTRLERLQQQCIEFNARRRIGDRIEVWTGSREDPPQPRTVAAPGAYVLGGHTAVVQVEGGGGCIALSHVRGGEA